MLKFCMIARNFGLYTSNTIVKYLQYIFNEYSILQLPCCWRKLNGCNNKENCGVKLVCVVGVGIAADNEVYVDVDNGEDEPDCGDDDTPCQSVE